jgi:hypothetical protein
MTILPKNERALKERFPQVWNRMQSASNDFSINDFSLQTFDNQIVLTYNREGKETYPYGKKKNPKLLDRWFNNQSLTPQLLYTITGFGLGYHIRTFLKNVDHQYMVFVGERDPHLLLEVFSQIDCSDILEDERFFLGVGEPDDNYYSPMQEAAVIGVQNISPVVYSPLFSLDESYYDKFLAEAIRQYLFLRPLMMASVDQASILQENILENMPTLMDAPDINDIREECSNFPVILVGAGPSLDESIDFLRKVKDKAIIICSNTPYRKLINSGITPHFVVAADPKEFTKKGFEGLNIEDTFLAAPVTAPPSVINLFQGKTFYWTGITAIGVSIRKSLGLPTGSIIVEQGTVSACILDIARQWGCKKLVFVGQDLAMTDSGKYYTEDSVYADEGNMMADTQGCHRLPGNTLNDVPVESRLFVYLKTFEQFIEKYPHIEYRNTARLGVKIQGCPYLDFEDALDWIGDTDNSQIKKQIGSYLKPSSDLRENTQKLKETLQSTIAYSKDVFKTSMESALRIEMLPTKFQQLNYFNNSKVINCLKDADRVNAIVDSNPEHYNILFEGKAKGELVQYKKKIKGIQSDNKRWEALLRNKEYYWALVEGANDTITCLEKLTNQPLEN